MQQLAIGDFVRLKIGREPMVVVRPDALQANHWICSWVDGSGQVQPYQQGIASVPGLLRSRLARQS